jgi:glycosyltransferase involved in cell wall biosynthesis
MAAYASCVLGVGPRLIEKYVPGHVPSFASTNHLLDEAEYRPRDNFELHKPPRILFVGEMKRRKGLHVLFKALGLLAKAGQPFEMVLVGTGPMTAELNQYAGQQGFSDRVRFVGAVPHGEQLFQYFFRSDVFVLPSVAAEGVPRVTHEAMAFGCPVIATDVGSVRWQLEGEAGIIVAPGDVEALARALRSVLADAALRCRLSGMGLQRSLQYTYDKQREGIARFVSSHVPQEYVRRSLTAAAS